MGIADNIFIPIVPGAPLRSQVLHPIFRRERAAPGGWNISHTFPRLGALF